MFIVGIVTMNTELSGILVRSHPTPFSSLHVPPTPHLPSPIDAVAVRTRKFLMFRLGKGNQFQNKHSYVTHRCIFPPTPPADQLSYFHLRVVSNACQFSSVRSKSSEDRLLSFIVVFCKASSVGKSDKIKVSRSIV